MRDQTPGARTRGEWLSLTGVVAMMSLQLAWHLWLAPPRQASAWATGAIALLPWIPVAFALRRNLARGLLWAGTVSLFYFAHGAAVAVGGVGIERMLGSVQALVALLVIVPPGLAAWSARRARRVPAR